MRLMVIKVIQEYNKYAKAKASRYTLYGLLQSIEPSTAAWEEIAFNHITKLPPSKEPMMEAVYDSIWVVTDRLTKYAYFILYKEMSTSEDLAYTYIRVVISQYGSPKSVITNRGTTFISKFWLSLIA